MNFTALINMPIDPDECAGCTLFLGAKVYVHPDSWKTPSDTASTHHEHMILYISEAAHEIFIRSQYLISGLAWDSMILMCAEIEDVERFAEADCCLYCALASSGCCVSIQDLLDLHKKDKDERQFTEVAQDFYNYVVCSGADIKPAKAQ